MDDFFGGMGWMAILLIAFIGRALKRMLTEERKQPELVLPEQGLPDEPDYPPFNPASTISEPEPEKIVDQALEREKVIQRVRPVMVAEQKSPIKKSGSKEISTHLQELKAEDVLLGVIFKEILDNPRARNPYRPHYRGRVIK